MTRRLVFVLVTIAAACNGPDPRTPQKAEEGVPANSASEKPTTTSSSSSASSSSTDDPPVHDPSQPYLQPVVADSDAGSGAKPTKTGKVSRQECNELVGRFVDLTVETDPRFQGIPPEMLSQLKSAGLADARNQKGDACDKGVTRAQYNCGIGATTPAEWQKCMK